MAITDPTDIANCSLWLKSGVGLFDATTDGSAVADGGNVARWEDQSGNGRNGTQGTAASQLKYDATNDFLCGEVNADQGVTLPAGFTTNNRAISMFFLIETQALRRVWVAGAQQNNHWLYYNGTNFGLVFVGNTTGLLAAYDGAVKASTLYPPSSLSLIGVAAGASDARFHVDELSSTVAAFTAGTGSGGAVMRSTSASGPVQGRVREVIAYSRQITTLEYADLLDYARTQGAPASNSTVIAIDGDSKSYGVGSTLCRNWEKQATWPTTARRYNAAESSITLATALSSRGTRVDVLKQAGKTNKLIVWLGTNDLSAGASAATITANLQSYCDAAYTAGWDEVYVGTIHPRSVFTSTAKETDRQTINTFIRDGAADGSLCDGVLDFGAAGTVMGDAGDEANTTYYADGVHETNAGYAEDAAIVTAAFEASPGTAGGALRIGLAIGL